MTNETTLGMIMEILQRIETRLDKIETQQERMGNRQDGQHDMLKAILHS